MQTELLAIQRVSGAEVDLGANEIGDLLAAQGDASYTEITRPARSFMWRNTTAVAALDAIGDVATNCALYNGAPDGGRSMIIDAIFAVQVGNAGAALSQAGMIFCLGSIRAAVPADSTIIPKRLNSIGPASDTVAITTVGGTDLDAVTGVAINWFPIGRNVRTMVHTLPGMSLWAQVDGRIIVSPGRYIGLHVLAASTDEDFTMGVMWHEKQLKLG